MSGFCWFKSLGELERHGPLARAVEKDFVYRKSVSLTHIARLNASIRTFLVGYGHDRTEAKGLGDAYRYICRYNKHTDLGVNQDPARLPSTVDSKRSRH